MSEDEAILLLTSGGFVLVIMLLSYMDAKIEEILAILKTHAKQKDAGR